MIILYIICALIVGFGLGIATVARRADVLISIERGSCAASKAHLEKENVRLWAENEQLRKEIESNSLGSLHSQP